ncbi:MAG: hypothetical protein AB7E47_09780 [Desulfovibrionaceae bacterium]
MSKSDDEKRNIERTSAEAFIILYNNIKGTDYLIEAHSDNPDFVCRSINGDILRFDVTLTEDADRDIQACLGRSDHRGVEATRRRLKEGRYQASCLSGNVLAQLSNAIQKKRYKDYGRNCALLVRAVPGVPWDWELVLDEDFRNRISPFAAPYSKGIWLLSGDKQTLYCVYPETADSSE